MTRLEWTNAASSWRIVGASALVLLTGLVACGGTVVLSNGGGAPAVNGTSPDGVQALQQDAVDKIDLLFMIDNSASMADKQAVLGDAVPDLLNRLVNPGCVSDADGSLVAGSGNTCPAGSSIEFKPIFDIHIGIISSSLGGHGSDSCDPNDTTIPGGNTNNDQGHLLSRVIGGGTAQTWNGNSGFLAWDPTGTKNAPPGETNSLNLEATFKNMVLGVGQNGCGFESQLKSWYRFLVDPQPPLNIFATVLPTPQGPQAAQLSGLDQAVLDQRAAFLRPDSLVAVILLSDENDCSVIENNGLAYLSINSPPAGQVDWIPSGTTPCKNNPNDPCCFNCGSSPPNGCVNYDVQSDPQCSGNALTDETDNFSLRCFDQKRKYGIDFLYPVSRYIDGLTQAQIQNRYGTMVPNPLYVDLQCKGGQNCKGIRSSSLVFFAGIVGVPWQDIAKDPKDLTKGFLSSGDINAKQVWPIILGDPAASPPVSPTDPLMIETPFPRQGTNPVTKEAIAGVSAAANANSINGHEYDTTQTVPPYGDLQYACVFDLPTPRDCSLQENQLNCDCIPSPDPNVLRSPLCQDNAGNYSTSQIRAKGYPGVRELQVLKGIGNQAIVGSICPKQITNMAAADYGYRPAVNAIIDKLKGALAGRCLPRQLTVKDDGQVPCVILEAFNTNADTGTCEQACSAPNGRQTVSDPQAIKPEVAAAGNCICEMVQLGQDVEHPAMGCLNDAKDAKDLSDPSGWCYIAPTQGVGTCAALGHACYETGQNLRFYGPKGDPRLGAKLFLQCPPGTYDPPHDPTSPAISCVSSN